MFDRVNDLSESLIGGSNGADELEPDAFAGVLHPDERAQHVLASDGIEHDTDGRTTTVEPEGDHAAYLVVTDERVLVVMGDQPETVEIAFDMGEITQCLARNGLLNETLVIGHGGESITFSPTAGDLEAGREYVETVSAAYRAAEASIDTTRQHLDDLVERIRSETAVDDGLVRVRSTLAEARHEATHEDAVPSEKLLTRVADVEREIEQRYLEAWLDRAASAREVIDDARDDDYERFCEAYTTAVEALSTLESSIEQFDAVPEGAPERVADLANALAGLDREYVEAAEAARTAAESTDDPDAAATHWLETYRRHAAAHGADWNRMDDRATLSTDGIDALAARAVDALVDHADTLEAEGENREGDDAETARERYETAAERLRTAREIVEKRDASPDEGLEERIAALTEKIDRTKWEWGAPGDAE